MLLKNKKTYSLIGKILAILLYIIFIPILIINITLIVQTYTNPDHLPSVFGIKPAIILSGSMQPTFDTNALVFAKNTATEDLEEGDIITFMTADQKAITHRIVAINTSDNTITYTTKGDANNTEDADVVTPDQVEGVYIGQIAGLGGKLLFMQTTSGMILCIIIPLLLYVAWIIFHKTRENKKEKKRSDALAAELKALKEKEPPKNL